jgi:hypothetical protein
MRSHASDLHPFPPGKAQSELWKQPQPQLRSPAPESRQHRQRLKLFLPASAALPRSAADAAKLGGRARAVKTISGGKREFKIQPRRDTNPHELARQTDNMVAAKRRKGRNPFSNSLPFPAQDSLEPLRTPMTAI